MWGKKAARDSANQAVDTDLDALLSEEVTFRFNGRVHKIKPISLAEFLKWTQAHTSLMDSIKSDQEIITPKMLAEKYHEVISAVCDSITVADVESMEQAQIAALYQLVIDKMTGQVPTSDGVKKKRMRIDLYNSGRPSSSPNSAPASGGQVK